MTSHADEGRTVMRAAPSSFVRFGLICGGLMLMWAFILSQRHAERLAWIAAAVVAGLCVVIVIWVSRFRLEYDGETIKYRTLFGGEIEVDIGTIASAEVVTYRERLRSRVRLELVGKPGAPFRPVSINVMIFRPDAFKRFTTFLFGRLKP